MNSTYSFSSPLGLVMERYINLKRSLGRNYTKERDLLMHLEKFLNITKDDLTRESFELWGYTQKHLSSGTLRKRMQKIRCFCLYRQRTEPSCFVPDPSLFPIKHQTIQPYIFTEDEIVRLYHEIKNMKSSRNSPVRQENFTLGLVLLYTTGLRRGELTRLTIGDYDATEHILLIRESKFHKSRLLPLSEDAWNEIEAYLKIRYNRRLPVSSEFPFLLHNNPVKPGFYNASNFSTIFNFIFKASNIHTLDGHVPRLQDFRHTFAVHALLRWYREGANVQAKLPMLSTYMGHSSVASTQYYLRFIDQVVGSASKRFEDCYSKLVILPKK